MLGVALAAVLVYALLTGATGARLLALAYRTRALPETALGISYLVAGMFGWGGILIGGALAERAPLVSRWLGFVGLFSLSAGNLAVALFCFRVFAPKSVWARAFFWLLLGTLVVDYFHNVILWGIPFPATTSFWYWPGMLGRTATYLWRPIVALRYHARLRRRLALGLADAVATNRVLLWGLAGLATCVGSLLVVAATLEGLWTTSAAPPLAMVTTVLGACGATMGWLAFVPPARYLAWVEARAALAQGADNG